MIRLVRKYRLFKLLGLEIWGSLLLKYSTLYVRTYNVRFRNVCNFLILEYERRFLFDFRNRYKNRMIKLPSGFRDYHHLKEVRQNWRSLVHERSNSIRFLNYSKNWNIVSNHWYPSKVSAMDSSFFLGFRFYGYARLLAVLLNLWLRFKPRPPYTYGRRPLPIPLRNGRLVGVKPPIGWETFKAREQRFDRNWRLRRQILKKKKKFSKKGKRQEWFANKRQRGKKGGVPFFVLSKETRDSFKKLKRKGIPKNLFRSVPYSTKAHFIKNQNWKHPSHATDKRKKPYVQPNKKKMWVQQGGKGAGNHFGGYSSDKRFASFRNAPRLKSGKYWGSLYHSHYPHYVLTSDWQLKIVQRKRPLRIKRPFFIWVRRFFTRFERLRFRKRYLNKVGRRGILPRLVRTYYNRKFKFFNLSRNVTNYTKYECRPLRQASSAKLSFVLVHLNRAGFLGFTSFVYFNRLLRSFSEISPVFISYPLPWDLAFYYFSLDSYALVRGLKGQAIVSQPVLSNAFLAYSSAVFHYKLSRNLGKVRAQLRNRKNIILELNYSTKRLRLGDYEDGFRIPAVPPVHVRRRNKKQFRLLKIVRQRTFYGVFDLDQLRFSYSLVRGRSFNPPVFFQFLECRVAFLLYLTGVFPSMYFVNVFIKHKNLFFKDSMLSNSDYCLVPGECLFIPTIYYWNALNTLMFKIKHNRLLLGVPRFLEFNYVILGLALISYPSVHERTLPFSAVHSTFEPIAILRTVV